MKDALWLPLFIGLCVLLSGCTDSRSSDSSRLAGEAHPGGHTKPPGAGKTQAARGGTVHEHGDIGDPDALWAAAANKVVISDQGSVPVRRTDTIIRVKAYGTVSWDRRRSREITTRAGGRVERLYVRYHYQYVRRGQKIMELYSPEIATYAAEYLHHLQTPDDEELIGLTKKKLVLLGITSRQISELETSGRLPSRFAVYSGYGGYALMERSPGVMTADGEGDMSGTADMGGGMDGDINPSQAFFKGATARLPLREGMYVNRGQTLFYVNDFGMAWGLLSFDARTQPFLKKGMDVVIKSELLPLPLRTTISFIEPTFDAAGQKFVKVRTYLPNKGQGLKINSLIEGSIDIALDRRLIIPAASVFSLGKRSVVWVKTGTTPSGRHVFTPREVVISLLEGNIAVVAGGLSPSEEVAANAGYLLDSQSLVEQ